MADTKMDLLSDEQIDRLLSEAESRLAGRAPQKSALIQQQSNAVVATTTTSAPGPATEPVKDQKKQAEKLTVRVPKPVIKEKKVHYPTPRSQRSSCPGIMMILYPKFNDAGHGPVMGPRPAPQ
jgi:hypothetical protein